jgi:hypothetical protein
MASFVIIKSETGKEPEAYLIEQCHLLGCIVHVKVHFLRPHLDFIRQTFLGDISKEIKECLHQDTEAIE